MAQARELPTLITEAAASVDGFRVTRWDRGYAAWRFRPWTSAKEPGWRMLAWNVPTREGAWNVILERLGLTEAKWQQPADPYFAPGYFDFSGF